MDCAPLQPANRLSDLLDRINRMARGLQFAHGLNPAQWDALRFFARANSYSRTPGGLALFLGTTKGTASQTINALDKKGLLTSTPDPTDKRIRRIVLTAEGTALLARDPLNCLDDAVCRLDPAVVDIIADGLERISSELRDRCGSAEVGYCQKCGHFAGATEDGRARCAFNQAEIPGGDTDLLCVNFQSGDPVDSA